MPVSVSLVEGARALGIGRTLAYELARRGEFPIPVLTRGTRLFLNRADLLREVGLGIEPESQAAKAQPA